MSAAEIIEQIKSLPVTEQKEVAEFVLRGGGTGSSPGEATIRYASPDRVRAAADIIFRENAALFQKLAE